MGKKISPELREEMEQIARRVFEEMIESLRPQAIAAEDLPPEPQSVKGRPGRRQDRDYEKVTVTIDRLLWERFCQERDHLGVSSSRMMDVVLWQRYGKPRLSFEPEQKPETTLDKPNIDRA